MEGAAVAPFLLARVAALTGGTSLAANIELVLADACLAAQVAVGLVRLQVQGPRASTCGSREGGGSQRCSLRSTIIGRSSLEGIHMVTQAGLQDAAAAVRRLARSPDALRRLAIASDCVAEGLARPDDLRAFFSAIAAHWGRQPEARWIDIWEQVCKGRDADGKPLPSRRFLRTSGVPPEDTQAGHPLETVVSEEIWRDLHVRYRTKEVTASGVPMPPFPLIQHSGARAAFVRIGAIPGWFKPPTASGGAWLGRPSGQEANCWISTRAVDAAAKPVKPPADEPVESAIPALGIWPVNTLGSFVRYSLDALELTRQGHGVGARPGFADMGSGWFRVLAGGPVAKVHKKHGWGSTFDLNALHAGGDDVGRAERVISPVPLDSPAVLGCDLLMPAAEPPPLPKPTQKSFDDTLLRGRKKAEIVNELIAAMRSPLPATEP